jgi:hypothetical protein
VIRFPAGGRGLFGDASRRAQGPIQCVLWGSFPVDKRLEHEPDPGRAMAQAVSRRPLNAEARDRSGVSPCEICGGQSGTGTGFSPSCRFSPVNFIPLIVKLGKKNGSSSS